MCKISRNCIVPTPVLQYVCVCLLVLHSILHSQSFCTIQKGFGEDSLEEEISNFTFLDGLELSPAIHVQSP